jgi:hypothetical protein
MVDDVMDADPSRRRSAAGATSAPTGRMASPKLPVRRPGRESRRSQLVAGKGDERPGGGSLGTVDDPEQGDGPAYRNPRQLQDGHRVARLLGQRARHDGGAEAAGSGIDGVTVVSHRETGTLVVGGVVLDEEDRAADGRVYDADAPP